MEIIKIVILSVSALMLLFVWAMRLSNPIKTYLGNSGIRLENDVDLLNEMRGVSSVMLCGGIIIALGIIFRILPLLHLRLHH
jgi:small neutral amino acid transporter SnatA (MarC family)